MACHDILDDPEFWLPPLFPYDDFKKSEFLVSESNSGFSSPVNSSMGSTETESDEDEFLTELTRRLTNSIHLSHDIWKPKANTTLHKTKSSSTLGKEEVGRITRDTQKPCFNSIPYKAVEHNGNNNPSLSPSAWPTPQQAIPIPFCGAALVMNNNNNVPKRGCSGTGVFLPRPTPSRRKHPVASKQRHVMTRDKSRSQATINNEIRLPQEWTY